MADRNFSDSGLGGPGLAYVPAPDDTEGQEAGVAQFGQLHPGPVDTEALRIKKNSVSDGWNSLDQASDTFGVITTTVDQKKAYQLLPKDDNRKSAVVMCFTNPIILGDQSSIDAILGTTVVGGIFGVFALPPSNLSTVSPALFAFEYTSKRSLWVACATIAVVSQVQCIVERFNSGVPVS